MAQREAIRVNFRASGEFLERLREVRDLCALGTEGDAARYLTTRGIEAMTSQLHTLRLIKKMEHQFSPQQLLPILEQVEQQVRVIK